MRSRTWGFLAILIAVCGHARSACAVDQQASDREAQTYVGGAVEISSFGLHSWVGGAPSLSFTNTTNDTWNFDATLEIGEMFGPHAIGVSIEIPFGRHDVAQSHGYFNPFRVLGRYQEWSGFLLYRGSVGRAHRVHGSVLGGVGLVFGSDLERTSTCNFDPSIPCRPYTPEQDVKQTSLAATAGSEVGVRIAPHLFIAPQFRVIIVNRGDQLGSNQDRSGPLVSLGIDRVSYRGSIGLRATF
jgi:hypothetical protein